MYSSLVNRIQSSEQGRAHACVRACVCVGGGEREVGGGKYMLMKTFIFHDFGHWDFLCFFHSTISNKTPTTSQHTRGILPTEWAVQGTPHCCNLGRQSQQDKKIHLGSYFWHHRTSPLTWSCLCGISSLLENSEKCCSLRPSFLQW